MHIKQLHFNGTYVQWMLLVVVMKSQKQFHFEHRVRWFHVGNLAFDFLEPCVCLLIHL